MECWILRWMTKENDFVLSGHFSTCILVCTCRPTCHGLQSSLIKGALHAGLEGIGACIAAAAHISTCTSLTKLTKLNFLGVKWYSDILAKNE